MGEEGTMAISATGLTPDVEKAVQIYEQRLKPILEPRCSGESIALDPETGEYELGSSHSEAARKLKLRWPQASIVTLTVGPPTPMEVSLAHRMAGIR